MMRHVAVYLKDMTKITKYLSSQRPSDLHLKALPPEQDAKLPITRLRPSENAWNHKRKFNKNSFLKLLLEHFTIGQNNLNI
jgi:hypothetical protein